MPNEAQLATLRLLIKWCEKDRDMMARMVQRMKDGLMKTGEVRDGRPVDTTQETIADLEPRIAELDKRLPEWRAQLNDDTT